MFRKLVNKKKLEDLSTEEKNKIFMNFYNSIILDKNIHHEHMKKTNIIVEHYF